MNKKISVMLCLIFCALLAQAQDAPTDTTWDADPLDVLEPQKEEAPAPAVPEFQEIGSEQESSTPADVPPTPEVVDVPAPEVAPTEPPATEPTVSAPAQVNELPPVETPSTNAMSTGEPDYSKEAKFHRIYKKYNEQPTSVEAWEKAVGDRKAETYKIQKGDTLSGLSTTLFGDQFFWPKIWSLNNSIIENPHEITPGMNVQFFPGSMDEAPTLDVTSKNVDESQMTAESAGGKTAEATETGVIPPPKKRTPLLKKLPNSLPLYRMGSVNNPPTDFQLDLPKTQFPAGLEHLGYFIADNPVDGVGVVTGTEMSMKTAGDYQYIYVRLNDSSSKDLVAQKNMSAVKDPESLFRKGHMVEVQGEIEVLEKVNDGKNIYRAIVKKAIQPVEVGAILTPGKLPMIDTSTGSVAGGVGAKIMGGQFDKKRSLFGSNSLVFLDRGSTQGLQEGQTLPIYADERIRNKATEVTSNNRIIGYVKVVRVSPNFATAYVTRATDDILLGDFVGKLSNHAKKEVLDEAPIAPESTNHSTDEDLEKEFEEAEPGQDAAPDSGDSGSELEL